MEENNKKVSMDFSLKKILIPKFFVVEDVETKSTKEIPIVKFTYGVGLSFNIPEKLAKIQFDIICKRDDKDKAELSSLFIYGISNFESFLQENGTIKMPDQFIATLISISASTCRGIWFEKTIGTSFKGILVPIIDPAKIAKDIALSDSQNKPE